MTRFTSVPQEIEAVQWTGRNQQEVRDFLGDKCYFLVVPRPRTNPQLRILAGPDGESGWIPVPLENWVAHPLGDITNVWPVPPGYFADKYRSGGCDQEAAIISAHESMKAMVTWRDPTDCEACGEIEYEPCLYHRGLAEGYGMAIDTLERAQ